MTKELTKLDLAKKIKAMGQIEESQRNGIICTFVGHSKVSTTCFGYRYCARCGDQVGDSLASVDYGIKEAVIVGHGCDTCRENLKKCDWTDKLYVRNPFAKNYGRSKYLETL